MSLDEMVPATRTSLPGPVDVGELAHWSLPVGPHGNPVELTGEFIGWATSQRDQHENHDGYRYAPPRTRCRACRWFEPRIFREQDGQERYLIIFAGCSALPGEVTHLRCEWAYSGDEVVDVLSTKPRHQPEPVVCPACHGTDRQCPTCSGRGFVVPAATRTFTQPAQRVLSQASSFDDEIFEAFRRRSS